MKKVIIITVAALGAILLIVLLTRWNTTLPDTSGAGGFVEEGTGPVRFTDKVPLSGFALVSGTMEGRYGIRYVSEVDKAYYDGLVGKYGAENVMLKTIIFPLRYVTDGMTLQHMIDQNKKYLSIPAEKSFVEQENTYRFNGVIQNIAESNYEQPFIGYGIIEINGGEIRYYPKEFDFDNTNTWRGAAVSASTAQDGTATVTLRYYSATRRAFYRSFSEEYGADKVSMQIAVCPLEAVEKAGSETLEALEALNPKPEYTVKKSNLTLTDVNNVIYAFYSEVSPFPESDLEKNFCSFGWIEIMDETGAVVRRIYR